MAHRAILKFRTKCNTFIIKNIQFAFNFKNRPPNTLLMPQLQKKVQKVWWKLWKSLSSRAQKRWTHQGSVQLKEPMSQYFSRTSVPKRNAKNLMDVRIPFKSIFSVITSHITFPLHRPLYLLYFSRHSRDLGFLDHIWPNFTTVFSNITGNTRPI